ncbi:MAG: SURF1 family protein [Rickettsiales bacterium]|jgi:surfeit locus 1 family protein
MIVFFQRNFHKPQLIPLIFIIISTIVLIYLGVWQIQRLEWKNGLIKKIEQAQDSPPLHSLPEDLSNLDYHKVVLTGIFKYEKALHMIGRQHGNFPGYFIVTPFELKDDGRIIIVNRGFSPLNKESKPDGLQTIEGIIRPARTKRFFAPENLPEKNVWFYENIPAMSTATNLSLSPLIVEQVGKSEKDTFPILNDGKIYMKNDHLGYAISWFSTAIIGLVMFGFYYRKTPQK